MHRTFEISLPSSATDALIDDLRRSEHVTSLWVLRGASVKPAGDVLTVHALNRGANHVLECARAASPDGSISVVISEAGSILDPEHFEAVVQDNDEAVWEDAETDLRHQAQLTPNYLVLMAMGGIVAATGFLFEATPQTIPLVAASVIAPGFETVALFPLSVALRRWRLLGLALRSAVSGYLVLALAAALAFLFLDATGAATAGKFAANSMVGQLGDPSSVDVLVSSGAAVAGVTMILAYRRSVIAGPLIALALIPATAMAGMALPAGRGDLLVEGLERLGLDLLLIFVWGLVVVLAKQAVVHRRRPLV